MRETSNAVQPPRPGFWDKALAAARPRLARVLTGLLLASAGLAAPSGYAQSPSKDTGWFGFNNEDYHTNDLNRAAQFIGWDKELGVGSVRIGYDANSRGMNLDNNGNTPSWGDVDAYTQKYLDAGLTIHAVIAPGTVRSGANYDQFEANYRYFVRQIATHYKSKIRWYIIGNEDDINKDPFGNPWTPATTLRMVKAAYEEIKKVDAGIIVESNPLSGPYKGGYLNDLLRQGVTNYCDVLGTHSYGGQLYPSRNDQAQPWQAMKEEGVKIVPVVVSEASTPSKWEGKDLAPQHAAWFSIWAYRQYKRFAYSHVLLFDLDGTDIWGVYPGTDAYNRLKNSGFIRKPLTNTGFESGNDVATEWVKDAYDDNEFANPVNPVVTGAGSGARTGSGYLRIDNSTATRVVEFLTPGTTYTLEVYANAESGTGRLQALGFNHLDGLQTVEKATSGTGSWQKLSLTFRPTKSWVVIGLQGNGGAVRFDDISISGGSGGTTPPPPVSTTSKQLNIGGAAVAPFAAEAGVSGGNQFSTTNTITTSGVTGAAPAAVYQTGRWGTFSVTVGGLAAGTTQKVRLHFAESAFQSAGQRKFNVGINGATGLTNLDVFAEAGANKALVKELTATANSSGQVVITFGPALVDNAFVNAVEVISPASTALLADGVYTLTSKLVPTGGGASQRLDVAGGVDKDGQNVGVWDQNGQAPQQWRLVHRGGNLYTITAQVGAKTRVLDADLDNGGPKAGSNVQIWASGQRWLLESAGNGYFYLTPEAAVSRTPKLRLDVAGGVSTPGKYTNVQVWTDNGHDAQKWKIEPVASAASLQQAASASSPEAATTTFAAFPNPSQGEAFVAAEVQTAQQAQLLVRNSQGQLVGLFGIPLKAGRTEFKVPTRLAPGLYYLSATLDGRPQHFTLRVD